MRLFHVIKEPSVCSWKKLLQVIDCVGMWHYSRTIPNIEDYVVKHKSGGVVTISCARTKTRFAFYKDWKCSFHYTDDKGAPSDKRTIEAGLSSAFDYVEKLIELELVTIKL